MAGRKHLYWGLAVACAYTCTAATPALAEGKLARARAQSRSSQHTSSHSSSSDDSDHHHARRHHPHSHHADGCGLGCALGISSVYYESDTNVSDADDLPEPTYASY